MTERKIIKGGDAAGNKLAALLRDHIMIATEVVKAAKMGNSEELTKTQAKWNANADDIAVFLSGANPIKEPVAWYGPIVMNTQEELKAAFDEYNNGTFVKIENMLAEQDDKS